MKLAPIPTVFVAVFMFSLYSVKGQTDIPALDVKEPLYINVNSASKSTVYPIYEEKMGILFTDNHGSASSFALLIFSQRNELVASFTLDKTIGLNHYIIKLDDPALNFSSDEIYICRIVDDGGRKYEWMIENETPEIEPPQAAILVNPKAAKCANLTSDLIEFYSSLSNGRAPYQVSWYVLNEKRNALLLQPREETLQSVDQVSMIMIDQAPAYYVALHVTDACGNVDARMVYVTCEKDEKKISSVFIDPLQDMSRIFGAKKEQ